MLIRKYAPAAALVLVLWALWLLWLWQPERQVRLHTTHFLKKVERRNWAAAREFLADDFTDRWGHDKNSALEDARQVFAQFLFLTIENRTDNCEIRETPATTQTTLKIDDHSVSGQTYGQVQLGTAHTMVKISGNGNAVTQMVMERVNGLHQPFTFTWRKTGSAPWDWQLTHIDQPELNIDPGVSF